MDVDEYDGTDEGFDNGFDDEYVYQEEDEEYAYEDGDSNGSTDHDNSHISDLKDSAGSQNRSSFDYVPDGTYVLKDYKDIHEVLDQSKARVKSVLDIDDDMAELVLQYFQWNQEKLFDQFMANSNELLQCCGLQKYDSRISEQRLAYVTSTDDSCNTSLKKDSGVQMCVICGDSFSIDGDSSKPGISKGFALCCNHWFCKPCYVEYLQRKISDGPSCTKTTCPQYKCPEVVTNSVFKSLLHGLNVIDPEQSTEEIMMISSASDGKLDDDEIKKDPEVEVKSYDKYRVYVTQDYVSSSKNMKYCPSPNCTKVAIGSGVTTIQCTCNSAFCFRCGEEAHEPCSCKQLGEWKLKCQDESGTAKWIITNTKKCGKCLTRIEKNQGCNHMTCKICKYEFCWICEGSWKDHQGSAYSCNRFKNEGTALGKTINAVKAELDRYLHYFNRYLAHSNSMKYAKVKQDELRIRSQMRSTVKVGKTLVITDYQFLHQAVQEVIACRRVLKYTYAVGYFLTNFAQDTQQTFDTLIHQVKGKSSEKDDSNEMDINKLETLLEHANHESKANETDDERKMLQKKHEENRLQRRQLFEHQQEMLEKNTEALQAFVDMSIHTISSDQSNVINLTRVTSRFREAMIDAVREDMLETLNEQDELQQFESNALKLQKDIQVFDSVQKSEGSPRKSSSRRSSKRELDNSMDISGHNDDEMEEGEEEDAKGGAGAIIRNTVKRLISGSKSSRSSDKKPTRTSSRSSRK